MLLMIGLLGVPLGVLALADPGATLAGPITVTGLDAVAVGVARIVLSFQVKQLPCAASAESHGSAGVSPEPNRPVSAAA